MRRKNTRIISLLLLFFILDVVRPFGYIFLPNLTFLALVSIAFYYKLSLSLLISFIAGAVQDSIIFPGGLFHAFVYPLIILTLFLLNNFFQFIKATNSPVAVKSIQAALLILLYSFISNLTTSRGAFGFLFSYFIQAYLTFFWVDYLIQSLLNKRHSVSLKKHKHEF